MVQLKECGGYSKEKWDYDEATETLVHRDSRLCLDLPLNAATAQRDEVGGKGGMRLGKTTHC